MAENPENREVPLDEQELLFNELNDIAENLELEISIRQAMEQSMVELKNGLFSPIYDEYYGSHVVGQFVTPKAKTGPCWEGYEQIGMKKGKGGKMVPNCVPIGSKSLDKWFKEDWVDLSRPKKGGGFEPCGRRDANSGKYPKCVPAAKAAKMTASEISSAVRRKRKAESTQTRVDKKPINVSTDKKDAWFAVEKKAAIPTNPELYARVKAQAKKKFDVYPSAYANAWLVREYKKRGGGYRTGKKTLNGGNLSEKGAKKPHLRDPKGGLTAAGRAHFKKTEGANLKPGVKGPADTPEKMRRKGSFLARFFTNPSGPMVDEKGRATRLALSATAWGERVPKNAEDAAKLAAKGRRLLEKYAKSQKKKSESITDFEYKAALGTSIGERAGGAAPQGTNPNETVDKDSDGLIFDGTENEQAKPKKQREPYEKLSNSFLEKRRRREVQRELARQGIASTRMGRTVPEEDGKGQIQNQIYDRPEKERDARATARAGFSQDADKKRFVRNQLKKQGITANAKKEDRDDKERAARKAARAEYDKRVGAGAPKKKPTSSAPAPPGKKTPATTNPKPADRYPNPSSDRSRKPADRYPDPPNADRGRKPADRYPDPPNADRGRKPADRYPDPQKPRGPKPADRYPNPSSDRSRKPADRNPNPPKKYPPGQKPSPKKPKAVNMPYPVTWERGEA